MYLFANDLSDPATLKVMSNMGLHVITKPTKNLNLSPSDIRRILIAEEILAVNKTMHLQIKKIANRNGGKLLNEGAISRLLATGELVFTTEHRLASKKKAAIELETAGVLVYNQSSTAAGADVIELTQDEILVLTDFLKSIKNDVRGVFSIIEFNVRRLRDKIPNYINQLRSGVVSFTVKKLEQAYAGNDPILLPVFKRQIMISSPEMVSAVRANRDVNPTNAFIVSSGEGVDLTYFKNRHFAIEKPHATKVILRRGDASIILYANTPCDNLNIYRGKLFSEMMLDIGEVSVGFTNSDILGSGSFTVANLIPTNIIDAPRDMAAVFIRRMMSELKNKLRKVVSIVIHSHKGKGKSYLSKRLAPLLEDFSGRKCYIVDSDNYGRMRMDISSYEDMIALSLDEIDKYNKSGLKSHYNEQAKQILSNSGIESVEQYFRLSFKHRTKLFELISDMMNPELLSGLGKLNEESFYAHYYGLVPENSCILIESHTVSRDAILGPTNLSMIYESSVDPYVILRNRDPEEELVQIVMHDYYSTQIGRVHATVNIWELNAMLL